MHIFAIAMVLFKVYNRHKKKSNWQLNHLSDILVFKSSQTQAIKSKTCYKPV